MMTFGSKISRYIRNVGNEAVISTSFLARNDFTRVSKVRGMMDTLGADHGVPRGGGYCVSAGSP